MQYRVLKAFNYSPNGVSVEPLAPGAELTIDAELAAGLCGEGFIEPLAADADQAPGDSTEFVGAVDVPDDASEVEIDEEKVAAEVAVDAPDDASEVEIDEEQATAEVGVNIAAEFSRPAKGVRSR